MRIILAPSKTLNISPAPAHSMAPTIPSLQHKSDSLRSYIEGLSLAEIATFFQVSQKKAGEVYQQFHAQRSVLLPAILLYAGDVYRGMYARSFSKEDMEYAQNNLLILSGLYGALRPLDAISPYRLEMRQKLHGEFDARTVQDFWGDTIFATYARDEPLIVNCASDEYAKSITRFMTPHQVLITPVFMDIARDNSKKIVPIYSKTMRGVLARYFIARRTTAKTIQKDLRDFSFQGYAFDEQESQEEMPVFSRSTMKPLVFPSSYIAKNYK